MTQKSFGLAFKEARKQGLDKFEWNGGWYGTKLLSEVTTPTSSFVRLGNSKQKYNKSNGTVGNRFEIKNHGDTGFFIYDNEIGRYIGNSHKDLKSAQQYLNSDQFKLDSGEIVATAAHKNMTRKTSGWLPVDSIKTLVDRLGNTRVFRELGTGRHVVTDNTGEIVGYSFDPNAGKDGFTGWIEYTANRNNLNAAKAGLTRNEANTNEVNLRHKQKLDKQVDQNIQLLDGIRRMQGGFNTIQGMLNMPNNIITGAIRAGVSDNYSWDDYKDSFTIDGLWRGNSSVGLGDILEIDNGYGRFAANLINPMSLATLRGGLGKKTTKGKGYNSHAATHNADAHVVQNKVTSSLRPVNAERMNIHERMSPNGPSRITDNIWNNSREQVGSRLLELGEKPVWKPILAGARSLKGDFSLVNPKNGQVTTTGPTSRTQSPHMIKATYERAPMTLTSIRTTPRTGTVKITTPGIETTTYNPWMDIKPFNAAFRYDPKTTYTYSDETPTAEFYYGGEGNSNTYAQGRIATGEVVPGTSGKNWKSNNSRGNVEVVNTKGHKSSDFGGSVIGLGKDNKSSWYLPVGY